MICDRCYHPETDGEHGVGLCPLEPRRLAPPVWMDSIPGGLMIEHGLCHDDGTPKRYDSRSEIRRACAVKGLMAWTDVWEESRTKDGRAYADYLQSPEKRREGELRKEERAERARARR